MSLNLCRRISIGVESSQLGKFSHGMESFLDVNPPSEDVNHVDLQRKKIIASGPTWVLFVTRNYVPKIVEKLQV